MAISTKKEQTVRAYLLVLLNTIFAIIAVVGEVGVIVTLPLWTGATDALGNPTCTNTSDHYMGGSSNTSDNTSLSMDPFFVISFASLWALVINVIITAVIITAQLLTNAISGKKVLTLITLEDDILFPQWQLLLIGVLVAPNGIFVGFASVPSRTAPFLQAILGNVTIPFIIFFRFAILCKRPTILKLLCAIAILLGLLLSLIPVITGLDQDSKSDNKDYLSQSRLSQILWPLCFMFGFIPVAIMVVIEEKSLKDTRKVNLFYWMSFISLYQLLAIWALFWADIIPYFGFTDSLESFGEMYKFSLKCFFGGAGCGYQPGVTGTVYIASSFVSSVGGGLLLRYAEGATYLVIVTSLVTPLSALFWSIFSRDECAHVSLHPHGGSLTYFSIGGIVIIVPAIILYNIGTFEELRNIVKCKKQTGYKEIRNDTTSEDSDL